MPSTISALSSKAIEQHLNVFAVFIKFYCKLVAMPPILCIAILVDMGSASIFGGNSLLDIQCWLHNPYSLSQILHPKTLFHFAILCAKAKLVFVATYWVDKQLKRVRCWCFRFLAISAGLIFNYCVENCWPKLPCFATKCLLILCSLSTANV